MAKLFRATIFSKGLILIAIPLLFELTFGFTMYCLQIYYRQVIAQETKAKAIIYHCNEMWLNTSDAIVEKIENQIFGTANRQTEEEENIIKEYEALRALVKDDHERMRQLKKIKRLCEMLISTGGEFQQAQSQPSQEQIESGGLTALTGRFSSFQQLQRQLKSFGRQIRAFRAPDELKSRDAEIRVAKIQSMIDIVIICAVLFSICMNATLLVYFMKGINRGILSLLENTKRMARSEPLLPELTGDDEFGMLDRSFHQMSRAVESANRREHATINNAGDMICVIGQDLNVISMNPAGTNALGIEAEAVKEHPVGEFISERDRQNLQDRLSRLVESGKSAQFQCRMVGASAEIIWSSWTVQWSPDDKEYFCVVHDITEQKRMEQMKQEFFGMISHDMRTPLTSIVTAVDCLLAGIVGELPEKANQYLELAEQSGQYLLSLVQDLLDMERLTAGAYPLKIETIDLSEIFKHAADMVAPLAAKADLSISVPALPFACEGDRDALTRVIVNLISNAIKFSPAGSSIEVDAVRGKEDLTVQVKDHGRGIPEEALANIFERFKQVELADSKKKGGSGLGLAICKGFVEAHGGVIGVSSRAGEGSTFWFRLPIKEPATA